MSFKKNKDVPVITTWIITGGVYELELSFLGQSLMNKAKISVGLQSTDPTTFGGV